LEIASQAVQDYIEEHAVEDGLLWDAIDDEGKLTSKLAGSQVKVLRQENGDSEEIAALTKVLRLFKEEAAAKKAVKEAQDVLDREVFAHYAKLSTEDIETLVVDDKWLCELRARIASEINTLMAILVARVEQLAQRYAQTVGELEAEVVAMSAVVAGHLDAMGIAQ